MKRILFSLAAASALILSLVSVTVAGQPEDLLCPDGWITKVESVEDGDLNDVILDEGTLFCVKAARANSGEIVADGETSLIGYVTWLNKGGQTPDVSHYVLYSPSINPTGPTPTPVPTCAPDDADCNVLPTPKPTPVPTPPVTSTVASETGGPSSGGLALVLLALAGVAGSSLLLVRKRA